MLPNKKEGGPFPQESRGHHKLRQDKDGDTKTGQDAGVVLQVKCLLCKLEDSEFRSPELIWAGYSGKHLQLPCSYEVLGNSNGESLEVHEPACSIASKTVGILS